MWVHEGFGTYCQALYVEEKHGREGYVKQIRAHMRMASNEAPIAPREATDSKEIYFAGEGKSSNDIYYKGSAVLHTLRWLVGDEVFFASLREMCYPTEARRAATDGSQVRFVDTEEYVAIVERLSGRELDWFFEVYVRQPQLPELQLKRSMDRLELRWESPSGAPSRFRSRFSSTVRFGAWSAPRAEPRSSCPPTRPSRSTPTTGSFA